MSKSTKENTPGNGEKGFTPSSPPKPQPITPMPGEHSYQPSSPPPAPAPQKPVKK